MVSCLHSFFQVMFRAHSVILPVSLANKILHETESVHQDLHFPCILVSKFVADSAVVEAKAECPNLVHIHIIFMACT